MTKTEALAEIEAANKEGRPGQLEGANLREANLVQADLRGAILKEANLVQAYLREANLEGADLSSADLKGAVGLPKVNKVNIDLLSLGSLEKEGNLLNMDYWHAGSCNTTHCRAGWAVILHPEGKKLEDKFGTNAAAAFIYASCYPTLKVPNWYATEDEAIEDMKSRSESYE